MGSHRKLFERIRDMRQSVLLEARSVQAVTTSSAQATLTGGRALNKLKHPLGSYSTIWLNAGLSTEDLVHFVVVFPSLCSVMSRPTKMLTTIPTLAPNSRALLLCVEWETTEVSLTVPGIRIKESVSLHSILAEILHRVYSFLLSEKTSFTQNITHLAAFTCPPKKSKTTSRDPSSHRATTTKNRVRQEKHPEWEYSKSLLLLGLEGEFSVCFLPSLCYPESEPCVKGLWEELSVVIALHWERLRVISDRERD